MSRRRLALTTILAFSMPLLLSACDTGGDQGAREDGAQEAAEEVSGTAGPQMVKLSDDYPLDTCVVSGKALGSMGDPIAVEYEDEQVQFCCQGCLGKFAASPAKFVAKVRAARKK